MSNRGDFDWNHRIKFLLKDSFSPKTYTAYRRAVSEGLKLSRVFLSESNEVIPSLDTIRSVHEFAFGKVYKDSGNFRAFGQEIAIGRDDSRGAYHSQIKDELTLLSEQAGELVKRARTPSAKLQAIVFYHLRYVKIHPFLDGNGRTGRAIFDHQAQRLLGMQRRIEFSSEQYIEGIQSAFQTKDLSQLALTLTGQILPKELSKAPFDLRLQEIKITREFPGGKKLTITLGEDVETAQEVEKANISPRLAEAVATGKKFQVRLFESTAHRGAVLDVERDRELKKAPVRELER